MTVMLNIHCNEGIDTTTKTSNIQHINGFDFIFDFQTSIFEIYYMN